MNFKIYAKHFHSLGLNVTCINKNITEYNFYDNNILKSPYHEWKHLKKARQTIEELNSYDWDKAVGLGTISGYNNVRVIDIDGCTDDRVLLDILDVLELPHDYEWIVQTGSKYGYHIYIVNDEITTNNEQATITYPPNIDNYHRFEKIEILCNTHVVLPESTHKSGNKYSFINCTIPINLPIFVNTELIYALIDLFLNREDKIIKKIYFDTPKLSQSNSSLLIQPSNLDKVNLSKLKDDLYFIAEFEKDMDIVESEMKISWIILNQNGIILKRNLENIFNEKTKISDENDEIVFKNIYNDLKYCKYFVGHNAQSKYKYINNKLNSISLITPFLNQEILCIKELTNNLLNIKQSSVDDLYFHLFKHNVKKTDNPEKNALVIAKCIRELFLINIKSQK